jgi:hypothetical protein
MRCAEESADQAMSAKTERKAFALLGPRAPLHKWSRAKTHWFCRTKGCDAKSDTPDDARACLPRLTPEHQAIVRSVSRNPGNVSGKRRELATMERIVALKPLLSWILDVRLATKEEDAKGIDIVLTTAHGKLFVQVKSGKAQAREWRKKYGTTIGVRALLVRWEGDRIAAPTNLAGALQTLYSRVANCNKGGEHVEVVLGLLQIVEAANGADWSTREHLKRFAKTMQTRSYNLAHHAFWFRQRAEDFRKMAQDTRTFVNREPERMTAKMYDDIATLFEAHATDVACGELCGFVHDGKEPYGMTGQEPCPCPCHRSA